jgi:peptide/nickel transport system substrate-binding protein
MWFNQSPKSPMPAWERKWFASRAFRNAVSEAINRDDLARIAFLGHAQPAAGPASPGNVFWFNHSLRPHWYDPQAAISLLRQNGFRLVDGHLTDNSGHPVRFSIITNAGNKAREKMALLIQQDLLKIGIDVTVVTLDFPSLLERIARSRDYEACILGFTNVEVDPMAQMNVWISSSVDHQWNPEQKSPATDWEAEVDELMRRQASTVDPRVRKRLFDRVQQIIWEQEPFIYLVNKHSLSAISPAIRNPKPARIWPQTFWNAYELHVAGR